MPLEIVPLEESHLQDAASLACARFRVLRDQVPLLPARYQEPTILLPWLHDLSSQAPGVAAIRQGQLAGFLLGMVIPEFRGKRGAFSPEWANAAGLEDSRWIYEEMYARLSARWVADGCGAHLVSILAHDRSGIEGWQGLGFGLAATDAIRGVGNGVRAASGNGIRAVSGAAGAPSAGSDPIAGMEIRRARPEDAPQMRDLIAALQRHLTAAPTFLFRGQPDGVEQHAAWLANPANALWLANQGTSVVAGMGQGPSNPDACAIIAAEGTTSIVSAFTRESARGGGIATALLNRALEWAREGGFERCAVDWEPMNILGNRFWTRHFQPVCYSLIRHIDERLF